MPSVTWKHSSVFIIIFTLLSLINSSCCNSSSPSSCGDGLNINCPFRLKGDSQKCDAPFSQELSCLRNRTVLYLNELLFYVQEINYVDLYIRIVDPGIQNNNSTSLPFHSITQDDLSFDGQSSLSGYNQPITMIECPSPVTSPRYINITSSNSSSSSASVMGKYYVYSYAYIVTSIWFSDEEVEMEDNCRINKVAWVSEIFQELSSMSEIHDALVYGFILPWHYFHCLKCEDEGYCDTDNSHYRRWACIDYNQCNILHLRSYHLSVSCEQ